MKQLLYYTRKPIDSKYYDARIAYSMHLAIQADAAEADAMQTDAAQADGIQADAKRFVPLNHNSGVLFALATENEDGSLNPKCIKSPYIFELKDKTYGITAIRTDGEGERDPESRGSIVIFESVDLIKYKETGLVRLSDDYVKNAMCTYDAQEDCYVIKWCGDDDKWHESKLKEYAPSDLRDAYKDIAVPKNALSAGDESMGDTRDVNDSESIGDTPGIKDIEGINERGIISIPDDIADRLVKKLTPAVHTDTIIVSEIKAKNMEELNKVRARAVYSDGTSALKRVDWDVSGADFDTPGEYEITGKLHRDHFEFPVAYNRADPCITRWNGKYYFIATNDADGNHSLYVREADSIPHLTAAEEKLILDSEMYDYAKGLLWAPEFHEIEGRLYIFLALTSGEFFCEESHIMELRKGGNPSNKADWSAPKRVVKKDGSDICEAGKEITLDMTCFMWQDEYYVVWSQRQFVPKDLGAWLYIARLDRNKPWQLLSDPVVLSKPDYGWANNHTFVDEGPFALPFDDRLVLTFSSAAVDTSYVVGMLTIDKGKDLLVRSNWEKTNYPILTSRSVPGEFGTGHNAYVIDEYGDIWNTYHARPGVDGVRSSGIRRVHFDIDNLPVLDMIEENDVSEDHMEVKCRLIVAE